MRSKGKRIAIAAAVIVGGALVLTTGLSNLVATFIYAGVYQSLFPATVSWESHGAYVKCVGAIADAAQWPATPAAACQAMHLCANEASLSAGQTRALEERMRKTARCGGCEDTAGGCGSLRLILMSIANDAHQDEAWKGIVRRAP